jgi:hypothetical protein
MTKTTTELLAACKAQHEAIDILFAMLILATKDTEPKFYPSASGKPWAALVAGNEAIKAAEADAARPAVDHKRLIEEIHLQMDGTEWDSETCSAIAEILTDAGYVIRDPNDMEDSDG